MKYDLKKTYLVITLSRSVAVLSNFILISVLVKELNIQSYGFYALLISMINWIYFFDLGINKGLKNIITNNFEKNKIQNLQNILNTTILTSILFFVFLVIPIIIFGQNILDYLENRTKIDESLLFKTCVVFLLVAGVKFVGEFYKSNSTFYSSKSQGSASNSTICTNPFNSINFGVLF